MKSFVFCAGAIRLICEPSAHILCTKGNPGFATVGTNFILQITHGFCATLDMTLRPTQQTTSGNTDFDRELHRLGLAGFFHLVEETGLNPGLNHPGRNRFLPPEVEETGKNWKKV